MALQALDRALPLEPPAQPLGARIEGVGDVGGLEADRRLDAEPAALREDPFDRGAPLALCERDGRRRLACSVLLRPQVGEPLGGVLADRLEPHPLRANGPDAPTDGSSVPISRVQAV